MDFLGVKQNGKFVTPPAIAEEARKYWSRIKDGTPVVKSLTVPRQGKTNQQVRAIWGLLMAMTLNELNDKGYDTSFLLNISEPTGNPITKEQLCTYLYEVCPIYSEGIKITLSKANIEEAAKFFEDCRNFIASQWGIHIPDPNPEWSKK